MHDTKKTKKDINDFPSSTNHKNFLGESNVDVPVEAPPYEDAGGSRGGSGKSGGGY